MSKRAKVTKKSLAAAKRAGANYARDQIQSTHFEDWIIDQLAEAERMRQNDPSSVIPLETPADYRRLARNMLQQLGWDIDRGLDHREAVELAGDDSEEVVKAFWSGLHDELTNPNIVHHLVDELMRAHEDVVAAHRDRETPPQQSLPGVHDRRPARLAPRRQRPAPRPREAAQHVQDYVAVDTRNRVVAGPFKDYGEAKRQADRAGGVVKFVMDRGQAPARVLREDPRDQGYDPDSRAVARNFPRLRRLGPRR